MRKRSPGDVQLGLNLDAIEWCAGRPALHILASGKAECPTCHTLLPVHNGRLPEHRAEPYTVTWTEDDGTIRVRRFPTRSMAERTASILDKAGIETVVGVRS